MNFMSNVQSQDGNAPAQMVTVEYMGELVEPFSIRSVVIPGKIYRFGNNEHNKTNIMPRGDADRLVGMIGGNNLPKYRVLGAGATAEVRDPASFLGTVTG